MTLARRIDKIKIQNSCGIAITCQGNFTTGIFAFQEKYLAPKGAFLVGGDSVKKFWNKAETSNDIYIYGEIVSERWDDAEVTAKSFLEDLKSCNGKAVNLHVNSPGGDVFQALAIYNTLKNYKGDVNVTIDGLAASAATLIICAGDNVKMASNALLMVHTPSVGLLGYFNAAELEKVTTSLKAVEGSILDTYKQRLPETSHADIAKMVMAEKYLTAEQAKDLGFVDEITGEVEMEVDDAKKLLFVNKVEIDCKNLGDKFQSLVNLKGVKKMAEKTETPKVDVIDVKAANDLIIKDAIKQERQRVKNLMALKGDNAIVNALIEVAVGEGAEVSDITPYIDAVKNVKLPAEKNTAAEEIKATIKDNMTSGAENVGGSVETVMTPDEKRMADAKSLAEMVNALRGVKRG